MMWLLFEFYLSTDIDNIKERNTQAQVVAPIQPVAINNDASGLEALEKLAKLHEQGILTDDEFQQKKSDLLAKI